jgi:hypothetical protein
MEKIPTAEEFLNQRVYITQDDIEDVHDSVSAVTEAMIDFATMHVEAALKAAEYSTEEYDFSVEIKNSYPLDKIK